MTHPSRVPRILNVTAEHFYDPRPGYTLCSYQGGGMTEPKLANYGRSASVHPHSLDERSTPVSSTLGLLKGTGFLPLLLVWGVPGIGAVVTLRRRDARGRGEAIATVLLSSIAILQFAVCAFADGIDTSKHLNLAVFTTACAWVTGAGAVLLTLTGRRGRTTPSASSPRTADQAQSALEHA